MQVLNNLTSYEVALDVVCGESGDRLVMLLQAMENNLGDEELVMSILQLLLNVFAAKETRELLAASGHINTIFTVIAMYNESLEVISLCITILGRLSVTDELSEVRVCNDVYARCVWMYDLLCIVCCLYKLMSVCVYL